jgi:hypothetical protein
MICPECKAEYRDGFTRCTDCDVKLEIPTAHKSDVDEMSVTKIQPEASAVLWRGQDPVAFSVVLSALDEQGIFYKEFQRRDYAAALSQPVALGFYGLPHWEVRVCATDLSAARSIAEEALRPVSALAVEANWASEGIHSDQLTTESPESEKRSLTPLKIWTGDVPSLAADLRDVLVNAGIRCWKLSSTSAGETLLVCVEDEDRARAILREALDRMAAA